MVSDLPLPDLQERLLQAVTDTYRFDWGLLNIGAGERSLTHKLAEHLQKQFPNWHVDCEYNRRGDKPKRLGSALVLPDVVIHRRDSPENLLVIEVKKANGVNDADDMQKLRNFRDDPDYQYRYGLFLCLGKKGCEKATLLFSGEERDWTDLAQTALKELGYGG